MKRVVVIAMVLAVMATLFAFPTYATTYNPATYNSYTDAVTYNGVTYNVRVTQLKALSEGTSLLPGGMETIMLVSLQMTNNTNSVKAATIPKLTIDLSDERIITDVYTYGGDFTLGLISGGITIFYPGSDFSLDNNKVVVPPNKSLYCVGAIGLPAQLSQDGSSTLDTGLRGVHLYDKSNYSVTDGNYSYGNPVDLSSVINYIDGIESALTTSNNNTTVIINRLNTILTDLVYTGSSYSVETTNIYTKLQTFTPTGLNGISISVRRTVYPVIVDNIDFEIDSGSDQLISTQSYVYKVVLYFYVNNTSGKAVKCLRFPTVNNFLPANCSFSLDKFNSEYFNSYTVNQNALLLGTTYRLPNNTNAGILPYGKDYTFIQYTVYSPVKITTWSDLTFNIFTDQNQVPAYVDDYYPESKDSLLYRIFQSLVKPENDDNTEEAQDMNDEIHEQEQVWYDQNSEALENVGLSNYRFSQSQSSGITQAVTQFQAVWNALGNWTNVYIFILILSISTYIIKHEPTTRVKQYRSSVQAERAERISYYGRKNAESRASASSGSTLKNAIRRRK